MLKDEFTMRTAFWCIVDAASIRYMHGDAATEDNPAHFGNVAFWKDENGDWCYDLPKGRWDTAKIIADLQFYF